MSFSDIQVVAKEWRRHCASWLVKAIYPDSEDLLQPVIAIPDGNPLELSITKEAKRRQLQTRSTKLRAEHRISFPTNPTPAPVFKRAPTPWSPEPADEFAEDEAMEAEALKRQKLAAASPKAEAKPGPRMDAQGGAPPPQ